MFSVKESDNVSYMCVCCWGVLAPMWPKQHKHANKSLSLAWQGEDRSQTPAATPRSTLLCIITHLSVEQRDNSDKKGKTFYEFFSPVHDWPCFCWIPLAGSANKLKRAGLSPKVWQPVSIICKNEQGQNGTDGMLEGGHAIQVKKKNRLTYGMFKSWQEELAWHNTFQETAN